MVTCGSFGPAQQAKRLTAFKSTAHKQAQDKIWCPRRKTSRISFGDEIPFNAVLQTFDLEETLDESDLVDSLL